MVMVIVIATDIAIAIPTSIIMDMAMGMEETKIKTYYFVYKKTTAMRWFFYECYFLKKIILIEIPEWTPIVSLAFLKGLSF